MTKYRLAKPLPFAKKGTEVQYGGSRIFVKRGESDLEVSIDALGLRESTPENIQKELQRLIDEGWIEEVKPREFEVTLNKNGSLVKFFNGKDRFTYINQPLCDYPPFETIKVREVIE